ncbi:T9SS type A sorting domain-containing protein [Cellulophaga baltica]|uniref:T9SS type A sorting domain-containing protein n=1 Tax=Cellulophaga baltica TaxID=76594 RepID=UPI0004266E2B|nr:T9SS type A sorting domain-containing protein [Cellulophaga baltica]
MKKLLLFLFFPLLFTPLEGITQNHKTECDDSIESFNKHLQNIYSKDKEFKNDYKLLKICAESGDSEASYLIGLMYKEGLGVNLNIKKAKEWFEKSEKLGNSKAAFSLGYLYLKGIGGVNQDYSKALRFFEESDYSMSKHWLAKCYYHGYGVSINKTKALELLQNNLIPNSQLLLQQWQYEMNNTEESEANYSLKMKDSLPELEYSKNNGIYGSWVGEWQIKDWSGEITERTIPIYIELTNNGTGIADINMIIDQQKFDGNVLVNPSELVFPDFRINLRKRYTDDPSELSLNYRITNLNYSYLNENGTEILSGELETFIENWLEPGSPSKIILHREGALLSQEIKDALSVQKDQFIKVYPNPFQENLLLYYTLDIDSEVTVNFYDYYNTNKILKTKKKYQMSGERTISFNDMDNLNPGLYIVQMIIGNDQHSRIVIKK